MSPLKKLLNFLNDNKIKYKEVQHKKVYTAFDKANTEGRKPSEISKTVVVKIENDPAFVIIPANKNLDKQKLKKLINEKRKKENKKIEEKSKKRKLIKNIDFATEQWMKKNLSGSIGAAPPFGWLWDIPTYVDSSLMRQQLILINSGDYQISYELSPAIFGKFEQEMIKGSFSKAK